MSTTESSLIVLSVSGISWKPGPLRGKKPNLYAALYRDGKEVKRTRTIEKSLEPKWEHIFNLAADWGSGISLRVFHDSSNPFSSDKCPGIATVDILALAAHANSENVEQLPLMGGAANKISGTISVQLVQDINQVAALAIETAKKDTPTVGPAGMASELLEAPDKNHKITGKVSAVATLLPAANDLASALESVTSKLDIVIKLGDQLATIHPYANVARKILTSVYQVFKKQKETDDKLTTLAQTMDEVYSFVKDLDFLPQKIKSLEQQTSAIVKQTMECALFIQEYTRHGFGVHAVEGIWDTKRQRIDGLCDTLLKLKEAFEGGLTVQSLFMSTKIMDKLEGLEQSETLKHLNPNDMNAGLRTTCLLGTRQKLLDEITDWITLPSTSGNVLWLSGVAGCGKSTISTTISERFRALQRLGAFLFFQRGDLVHGDPGAVVRTLAYSLGLFDARFAAAITAAINRDAGIVNAPIRTQFAALLLAPLQSVEQYMDGPILILLDALDECGNADSHGPLLSLLADEFPKLPRVFRFLITSRRESDIVGRFKTRFEEISLDPGNFSGDADIKVFFQHQMAQIREQKNLDAAWPGEVSIQELVCLSGNLFIWASTATRFIAHYHPQQRLDDLLSRKQDGFNLDELYSVALRGSAPWDDTSFAQDARNVLTCLVFGKVPMTDNTIEKLLQQQSSEVLDNLGCVLYWKRGQIVRALHTSFIDYLVDPKRTVGMPWALNATVAHHTLSTACFRVLHSELRFNIGQLEDSNLENFRVHGLAERLNSLISPQLQYSACFVFEHLREVQFDSVVLGSLQDFFHRQFLYWLEVLGLFGGIHHARVALEAALKYVKLDRNRSELEAFVTDAVKFVTAFAPVMTSTPHVYLSALPFTPARSPVAQQYAKAYPGTLQFPRPADDDWPSVNELLQDVPTMIMSVHMSSDGSRIAYGSFDGALRVWDVATGLLAAPPFRQHTLAVMSVCYSFNDKWIVSGSLDGSIWVWAAATGKPMASPFRGHSEGVCSVCFSHDASKVVSASVDGSVRIWDAITAELLVGPLMHPDIVRAVDVSSKAPYRVVSGCDDGSLHIWDAETGALMAGPIEAHRGPVTSVSFSSSCMLFASSSWDCTVRVWDGHTGKSAAEPFCGHGDHVECVRFAFGDDGCIASSSSDRTVRVWNARTGAPAGEPLLGQSAGVNSISLSADGRFLASGSMDMTLRVWDFKTLTPVAAMVQDDQNQINSISWSSNGDWIVSGSTQGILYLWDVRSGKLVWGPIQAHSGEIDHVCFSPDSAQIATGSESQTVCVWDASDGKLVLGPLTGHQSDVNSVNYSQPEGARIVSGSNDGTIRIWDAGTGALAAGPHKIPDVEVRDVRFQPNNSDRIVSCSSDGIIRMWDSQNGTVLFQIPGNSPGCSIAFSSDGSQFTSNAGENKVAVWNATTGRPIGFPFSGHSNLVSSLSFSPPSDNTRVASGSADNTVRVWGIDNYWRDQLYGHTSLITSVQFCPTGHGSQLASASMDGIIRIWEMTPAVESPLGDSPLILDGWITGPAGQLKFWVPPWLSSGLYYPRNSLLLGLKRQTKLDLSRFVEGTDWEKCTAGTI
ncbi:WD40-repeat-containing domain protein [Roridomyces roridus]|uniref:WD40-repeat-containing domain protein n=1 Tax=Roridomyces roridus TaxID=1738132 RepID=A0AAD7B6C9_9AGAR|nr:WD40-repeat-containing domain protein [Roridomyces roridus]